MANFWKTAGTFATQLGMDLWGENREHQREKELMGLEHGYDQAMLNLGHDKQYEMWQKTSFPAQLEMLRKAGLSPGLMYKQGGNPGQTGSQTGSSSASGNAAKFNPMDIANLRMAEANIAKTQEEIELSKWQRGAKGRQEIAESIAREKNVDADTKLKAQQKLNLIADEKLSNAKTKLEKMKFEKGVTGSFFVDVLTQMGLNPMESTTDRVILNGLLGLWFGAGFLEKLAGVMSRGKFAQIFGNKKAQEIYEYSQSSTLDGKGVTIAPKGLGIGQ